MTGDELRAAWERDELSEWEYIEGLRHVLTVENAAEVSASLPPRIRAALTEHTLQWWFLGLHHTPTVSIGCAPKTTEQRHTWAWTGNPTRRSQP